jgi:REP element-mobilizing transposase RayT
MRKKNEVIVYKNSQKRFSARHAIYFITTNTHKGFPYFAEDIFCASFLDDLMFAKESKQFKLYGYKINDDHIHFMIQPKGEFSYSEIMHNLKRVSSLHINQIIKGPELYSLVEWTEKLKEYRLRFINKHGNNSHFRKFKWHPSFLDHMIRGRRDFPEHIKYIRNQWIKHNQRWNKYCYIDDNLNPEPS